MTTQPSAGANTRTGPARLLAVDVLRVRMTLRKRIRHASYDRGESESVFVRAVLDDGAVGFGEGVPREYVTGETPEQAVGLLRGAGWADLPAVADFPAAVAAVDAFDLPAVPGDARGCVGNSARCAAELALLDAFGRRFGVCLRDLPRHVPEAADLYRPVGRCRYGGAITSKPFRREILSALKMKSNAFRHYKVKVGAAGQDDVRRLKWFRRILGRFRDIRLDANEAWSPEEVVDRIRALEPFRISSVEQPVRHEDVACLTEVRRQVSTPIMHDESVCSLTDAQTAIADGTCDLFNIRISKNGGLIPSLRLAALARRSGLGYQLGCQVGESGILSAAGRHFATSVAHIRCLEGSYDAHLVTDALTVQNLTFGWRGVAKALPGTGLGIDVAEDRLPAATLSRDRVFG